MDFGDGMFVIQVLIPVFTTIVIPAMMYLIRKSNYRTVEMTLIKEDIKHIKEKLNENN